MALTAKQKYEDALIGFTFSGKCFAIENFHLVERPDDLIVSSYAILLDDHSKAYRKKAAYLILKFFVRPKFLKIMLKDDAAPFERSDPRAKRWAKIIKSNGKCAICGSTENLEAHHILKWSEYPKGRADLKNGICLCRKCHCIEHEGEPAEHLIKSKAGGKHGR